MPGSVVTRWVRAALCILLVSMAVTMPPGGPLHAEPDPATSSSFTSLDLQPGEHGRGLGYGAAISGDLDAGIDRLAYLGFGWVKLQVSWPELQPHAGGPVEVDSIRNAVAHARARNLQVLLRIHESPGWAADPACPAGLARPPAAVHLPAFEAMLHEVAGELRGMVTAYEIWNEPNTQAEWGSCAPDPARFVVLMEHAYRGIKVADPAATVVTGGLSNTGDGSVPGACGGTVWPACGDLMYLQELYESGGRSGHTWDALGAHPYGGTCTPESPAGYGPEAQCHNQDGLYFRRMDAMRHIINDFGVPRGEAPGVPVWATEMGWLTDFDRGCNIGSKNSSKVSLAEQGEYLRRAYDYAAAHMPHVGPLILFLVDHNVGFDPACDSTARENPEFRWYSLFDEAGNPTSAAAALRGLTKIAPGLRVEPEVVIVGKKGETVYTAIGRIGDNGVGAQWLTEESVPWLAVPQAAGAALSWQPGSVPLRIDVPSGGSGTQVHTGLVSVTAHGIEGSTARRDVTVTVYATDNEPGVQRFPVIVQGPQEAW